MTDQNDRTVAVQTTFKHTSDNTICCAVCGDLVAGKHYRYWDGVSEYLFCDGCAYIVGSVVKIRCGI